MIYSAREFIAMDPSKPRAEVEATAGKGARVDNTFGNKVVIAGFVEQHVRPALAGHTDKTKPFVTRGYHHYFQGEMSRDMLNRLAPDIPVIVWHRSAHEVFLNDAALKLTGIVESVINELGKSAQAQLSLP